MSNLKKAKKLLSRMNSLVGSFLFISFFILLEACQSEPNLQNGINWSDFMKRHDLIWEKLPNDFREGPWTGNGLMGSLLWYEEEQNMLRLQIFRTDVHDHGPFSQGNAGVSRGRFQIGSFYLKTEGKVTGCDLKLDIWDAKLKGRIITDKGEIKIDHFTHTNDLIISTTLEPSEGEKNCKWIWKPSKATSTRKMYAKTSDQVAGIRKGYKSKWISEVYDPDAHGEPEISTINNINYCRQTLKYGGEHSTAWSESADGEKKTLLVSITKNYPQNIGNSSEDAVKNIQKIQNKTKDQAIKWVKEHENWWHNYYQKSFLSLNDTRVETVYWTQIYKLACATRHNRPMMDTAGPWQVPSPWAYITWDLNVQLCYWLPITSNHIDDIGVSLVNHLDKWKENLIKNVEPKEWQSDAAFAPVSTAMDLYMPRYVDGRDYSAETGGHLTWAMHNCFMMYEATQDKEMLKEKIFPLLKRAVNYQFHILHKWEDGSYGFVNTSNPEFGIDDNANYELSTFRWGCETLLEICEILNLDDPLIPKWEDALTNLVDFQYDDATGYKIGKHRIFEKGHRHYSHLLQIYPFYLVNIEQKGERERMIKSIDHFHEVNYQAYLRTGTWNVLAGYSRTGLASLYSTVGEGDSSLEQLNKYIDYNPKIVQPNGLYAESGPCLETPLSAGQAILDMLIQSWGDKIRIFPAVPGSWTDICFDNLRTKGAFLVSAKRSKGITQFVKIKSLAGQTCKVKLDFIPTLSDKILKIEDGVFEVLLEKDEEIVILNKELNENNLTIQEVKEQADRTNWFGLNSKRDRMKAE